LPVHVPGAKFSVGDLHFSRELFVTRSHQSWLPCISSN
jgi:hypothetical protein